MAEQPINHAVSIDMNTITEGENTLVCTLCQQPIVLLWDGTAFRSETGTRITRHLGKWRLATSPPPERQDEGDHQRPETGGTA